MKKPFSSPGERIARFMRSSAALSKDMLFYQRRFQQPRWTITAIIPLALILPANIFALIQILQNQWKDGIGSINSFLDWKQPLFGSTARLGASCGQI